MVVAIDADRDGDWDVVVACSTGSPQGVMRVWNNQGNGSFKPADEIWAYESGSDPTAVMGGGVVDVDGDGNEDLLVVRSADSHNIVVFRTGGPALTATEMSVAIPKMDYFSFAVADINGDGAADLIMREKGPTSAGIAYFLNSKGVFQDYKSVPYKSGAITGMAGRPVAGKAPVDLVAVSDAGLTLFNASTEGLAGGPALQQVTQVPTYVPPVSADFDGDGTADVVTFPHMLPSGPGGWVADPHIEVWNGKTTAKVMLPRIKEVAVLVAGDFNVDGRPDIYLYTGDPAGGYFLLGRGNGAFDLQVVDLASQYSGATFRDVNGDGLPDIIVGGPGYCGLDVNLQLK